MEVFNSKEILEKEDLYDLQESFSSCGRSFQYILTKDELHWLDFVRGRYSIAEWIDENLNDDILTFVFPGDLSQALSDDGVQFKAVCLSDDTALQKLFFWLSEEVEETEDD